MPGFRFSALLLTLLAGAANADDAPQWRLIISDNALPEKTLYLAVYEAAAGSWEAEPVLRLKQTLPEFEAFARPLALPPGRYALRVFVDLDNNGELTLNDRDRPAEPYASSQGDNQRPSPLFERSLVTLGEDQPELELRLRYPPGTRP